MELEHPQRLLQSYIGSQREDAIDIDSHGTIALGLGLGNALGAGSGVAIGAITGDLPFWLGVGIGLGASMGTALGVVVAQEDKGSDPDGADSLESV